MRYYDPDPVDSVLKIFVGLSILAIVLLLGWLGFILVDSAGVPEYDGTAQVLSKTFTPSWVQTIVNSDGKGGTYISVVVHPDSYSLQLSMDREEAGSSVDQTVYHRSEVGQSIPVKFKHGRLSKSLYLDAMP